MNGAPALASTLGNENGDTLRLCVARALGSVVTNRFLYKRREFITLLGGARTSASRR
jgi:hypothetical protein